MISNRLDNLKSINFLVFLMLTEATHRSCRCAALQIVPSAAWLHALQYTQQLVVCAAQILAL